MAYSMTGFGRGEKQAVGKKLLCEVKSVNNRYCDIQVRLPRQLTALDVTVRDIAREKLSRGKIDFNIQVEDNSEDASRVYCDIQLAEGYKAALEELGAVLGRPCLVQVSDLAQYPGVLQAETAEHDQAAWQPLLVEAVEMALDALVEMRRLEGYRLTQDVLSRAERLEELRQKVELRAPLVVNAYREKLQQRIEELLGEQAAALVDETRLSAEILLFADKAAVDEELVRLASHFAALKKTVRREDAVGKKLDFIVQEINREVNTIGSKANDLETTALVVEMKSEVEKIREQIQNLE